MDLTPKIPNLFRTTATPLPPKTDSQGSETSWNWKLLAFEILAVLLAAAAGYLCLLYFSGGANLIVFAAVAALFLITSFFSFLFARGHRRRRIVAILQMLAFLAFFYAVKPTALLSALGVLIIAYFWATYGAYLILDNSLKFRLGLVARVYMKRLFIGFALAAILLYLPQWNSGNVFIPQPKFQKWYDGFASISQRFYTGADLKANVGVFAENIARTQLSTNSQFRSLPAKDQEQIVQKSARELIANTSKSLGISLGPEMPLAEAFYKYLVNFLTGLKTQFGDSFLAAWAVALFVIVLSIGTLMIWAVVVLTYLLFEFFAAFNIVHIAGEASTKEIVELS